MFNSEFSNSQTDTPFQLPFYHHLFSTLHICTLFYIQHTYDLWLYAYFYIAYTHTYNAFLIMFLLTHL